MATITSAMSCKTTDNDVAGNGCSAKEASKDWSVSNNKADEPTPEVKAGGKQETEKHPQGFVFAMIMISVLSSLFLVALVILRIMSTVPPRID